MGFLDSALRLLTGMAKARAKQNINNHNQPIGHKSTLSGKYYNVAKYRYCPICKKRVMVVDKRFETHKFCSVCGHRFESDTPTDDERMEYARLISKGKI